MESIFMEVFKVSPVIGILGLMYYYQRKDYTKLVEDTRKESNERESKLQNTIDKCQSIISDLAKKFDVVEDVKLKVEEIEKEVNKISEKFDDKKE